MKISEKLLYCFQQRYLLAIAIITIFSGAIIGVAAQQWNNFDIVAQTSSAETQLSTQYNNTLQTIQLPDEVELITPASVASRSRTSFADPDIQSASSPSSLTIQKENSIPALSTQTEFMQTTNTVHTNTIEASTEQTNKMAVETTTASDLVDKWIDDILDLTNAQRQAYHLKPLRLDPTLNQAAAVRTSELPASPSPHLRPDGSAFYSVLDSFDLEAQYFGENYIIASANSFSPSDIVSAWMNSPMHRKNILNPEYTALGIGHRLSGSTEYFEQLFMG
jgi:uncharacterized protein YkwD